MSVRSAMILSFKQLYSIPFHEHTTVYLISSLLIDIWAVFHIWLLEIL